MMKPRSTLLLLCGFLSSTTAFLQQTSIKASKTTLAAELDDKIADIGYGVIVEKPLGVIFGENDSPYFGLIVDDVEPGLNGGRAGLRVGDQLLAVNGESVVGASFDSAMSYLINAPGTLELQMFRGNVGALYTILGNRDAMPDDEEEEVGEVVMDNSYESPVKIDVEKYDDKPLTAGDVFKAFGKVTENLRSSEPQQEKKKGGFFGGMFSGETVQLEGSDAVGFKQEKKVERPE